MGGQKSGHKFESTYWKRQQEQGAELFGRLKLFAAPAYMIGFDHEFVQVVSVSASARPCSGFMPTTLKPSTSRIRAAVCMQPLDRAAIALCCSHC